MNQEKFSQISSFEAVILVSQRAYDLKSGSSPEIECPDSDKLVVVALKELEEEKLDHEKLYKLTLRRMRVFSGSSFSDIPSSKIPREQEEDRSSNDTVADQSEVKSRPTERNDSSISFSDEEEE